MRDQQSVFALKLALAFAAVTGAILVLAQLWWVMRLVIISILVVYALNPAVDYLARFPRIPRLLAVVIVFLSLILLTIMLINLVIPIIISELQDLARFLPRFAGEAVPYLQEWGEFLERPEITEVLLGLLEQLPRNLQQLAFQATALTRAVVAGLAEIAIILFMVFYLLRDNRSLRQSLLHYAPAPWKDGAVHLLGVLDAKVGAYLRGNLVRCGAVGILTGVILGSIGLPFAFMLGVLAGLLNIIVYIGPYLAAIPAVLIALSQSLGMALLVAAVYISVQALDAFVLTPNLLGRAVNLHPFSVIVAILVGAQLLGLLGIIVGIPVAATLKVLLDYYYRREV